MAAIKRKSEERLYAAILRLDEEEDAEAAKSGERLDAAIREERLLDAAIHREDEKMKDAATAAAAVVAAAAAKRKEIMEAETVAAAERWRMEEAAAVAAAAAAIRKRAKRKGFLENAGNQPSCALWCSHVGCSNNVHARGVCRDHGPRCSYVGCGKNVYARGVCKTCSSPAKEPL